MKSSKGLEKENLLDQLLDLIDRELLGGERPVKTYEVIYYKDQIPENHGGKTIITAIPKPDTPLKKDKNDTAATT